MPGDIQDEDEEFNEPLMERFVNDIILIQIIWVLLKRDLSALGALPIFFHKVIFFIRPSLSWSN